MSRSSPEPRAELTSRLALRTAQAAAALGVSEGAPREPAERAPQGELFYEEERP